MSDNEITHQGASGLEFSRPVRISDMGKAGLEFPTTASEAERAALAKRLGVLSLNDLEVQIRVQHWRKGGAQLTAQVKGNWTLECVVSLEPFDQSFEDTLEVQYADPRDKILMPGDDGELILDPSNDDIPEIVEGGSFDVGEAVAQHLGLILDAYPRKPGVGFADIDTEPKEKSPFSVLEGFKTAANDDAKDD